MKSPKIVFVLLTSVTMLGASLALPDESKAQITTGDRIGQFMVGKIGQDREGLRVVNPTNMPYFVLLIVYQNNGRLELEAYESSMGADDGGCVGFVVDPYGTDEDSDADSAHCDDNCATRDRPRLGEAIAVPIPSGAFIRSGRHDLGVEMVFRKGGLLALAPSIFNLPATSADRHALNSCACASLAANGQSPDLLSDAGFSCV